MPLIASIEDDIDLQELLVYSLQGLGYEVSAYSSAEAFFEAAGKATRPDLILLDIMLPGMSGMDALKKLKSNIVTKFIPVIMLTAKSSELSIAQGLEEGADDYVVKPYSIVELGARVKANLRKCAKKQIIEVGLLKLDCGSREVTLEGRPLKLTLKEFELLHALVESPNIVQEREKLLTEIWGADFFGETRTLDAHMLTLRAKLGSYAEKLVTVRGVGYKFCL